MNLTNLANKVGKSKSYFFVVRKDNKKLFDFYFSFDKDNLKSYYIASQKLEDIILNMQDICIEMGENKLISKFGRYLCNKGVYKHPNSFPVLANRIYIEKFHVRYETYLKCINILKLYEDFKKELENESKITTA